MNKNFNESAGKNFDEFMEKRGKVNRKPPIMLTRKGIVDKILEDLLPDLEITWILQGGWHERGINPSRITDKERNAWIK